MMLVDKGYFDYDFEKFEVEKPVLWEDTVKSEEELHEMLAGFGFGLGTQKKPETLDEIQEHIIKQESYGS